MPSSLKNTVINNEIMMKSKTDGCNVHLSFMNLTRLTFVALPISLKLRVQHRFDLSYIFWRLTLQAPSFFQMAKPH